MAMRRVTYLFFFLLLFLRRLSSCTTRSRRACARSSRDRTARRHLYTHRQKRARQKRVSPAISIPEKKIPKRLYKLKEGYKRRTEANFAEPSEMSSPTSLPLSSEMSLDSWSSSLSIPTALRTPLMSLALGEALPPIWRSKYAAMYLILSVIYFHFENVDFFCFVLKFPGKWMEQRDEENEEELVFSVLSSTQNKPVHLLLVCV